MPFNKKLGRKHLLDWMKIFEDDCPQGHYGIVSLKKTDSLVDLQCPYCGYTMEGEYAKDIQDKNNFIFR